MPTYLLAWNPTNWEWSPKDLTNKIKRLQAGIAVSDRWSLGGSHRPQPGDRFFLIKLGIEPRGIIGSGDIISEPFLAPHYSHPDKQSTYAMVKFDHLVDGHRTVVIAREELEDGILGRQHWDTQRSGILITPDVAASLEVLWAERVGLVNPRSNGEEISGPARFIEGGKVSVQVNRYERDLGARRACLEHHGTKCSVCSVDLSSRYGKVAAGFIHVHHLKPLATIGEKYAVDPIRDLRPVCPNCHAVLHLRDPAYSIEDVQKFLVEARE